MGMPTRQELETALAEAERLRTQDDDPHHLANCLLYLNRRDQVLERLLTAVEHYLNSGHAHTEHARLIKAVDAARHQIWEDSTSKGSDFGL